MPDNQIPEGAAIAAAAHYTLLTDFTAQAKFNEEQGWHALANNALGHKAIAIEHEDKLYAVPFYDARTLAR